MNESTIDILLVIIDVVIIALTGVLAGWVWGYQAAYRKVTKLSEGKSNVYIPGLRDLAASRIDEARCIQCGATMPDHYHGCILAAEFKLVTIAKPGG